MNLLKYLNKKKINSKKTYFYKFLSLKWFYINKFFLKKLQIYELLILFFVEKNKIKKIQKLIKKRIFNWFLFTLHKKTTYIWKMWLLEYFNNWYLPELNSKWFLKKLFWFWHKKYFWSKLKKINYQINKAFIFNKWHKFIKKEVYFLARDAISGPLNLIGYNIFKFWKKNLILNNWKLFYKSIFLNRIIFKNKNKKLKLKQKLSFILSKKLKKIFFNSMYWNWFLFFKRKFFNTQYWTESFYSLFKYEFYVPFQIFFFWKSIIWFTKLKLFILPTKELIFTNFSKLTNFIITKYKSLGLDLTNFINYISSEATITNFGLKFFNLGWLWKLLVPIYLFFFQFKKSYKLPIANLYIDMFFLKKKFLPKDVVELLEKILWQVNNPWYKSFELSEDTENNNLLTLLFYWFINEIFELIFSFSPGEISFFDNKQWRNLFNNQIAHVTIAGWNWDFLNCFSRNHVLFMRERFFINWIKIKKKKSFFINFFDFNFFLWKKQHRKIWNEWKIKWKKKYYSLNNYLVKHYWPYQINRIQLYWWTFYMYSFLKKKWQEWRLVLGKSKIIYDSFYILKYKFWEIFFTWKTSFEWLYIYAFQFRNGILDFDLNWNFYVGYQGSISIPLKKKKWFKIGKKQIITNKVIEGFSADLKKNSLFSTFFTFLNRNYLLQYLVQFGHVKSNYNSSFKDYLVMIYNERFILNILNIQLNLKWNLRLMFKMFYLGGFICLVAPFNFLLEGLVGVYGCYSEQPYTRHIWINGLFSNFDTIFWSLQIKMSDIYSAWIYLTRWIVKELMHMWFSIKGIIKNLTIDISFFPSVYWSSWVFLEACAKFYPTITISNTECFLPTVFLEYTIVSNDYSLLSLSLYLNLLIVIFKKSKLLWQVEFSVYPQKLFGESIKFKKLPFNFDIKHYKLYWWAKIVSNFVGNSKSLYFDVSINKLADVFKYLFIHRWHMLFLSWWQTFWWFLFFWPSSPVYKLFL